MKAGQEQMRTKRGQQEMRTTITTCQGSKEAAIRVIQSAQIKFEETISKLVGDLDTEIQGK
jgi:hypothetical protein